MDPFFARFFPHDGDATVGYHRALREHLPHAGRVLDCGCGDNTDLAGYRTPGREVWGVDFRPHPRLAHPEWFRPLGPRGDVPFPPDSFDLIAARWVLEHVQHPQRFLAEVVRLLRPGGSFVALTVNAAHYVTLVTRLLHLLPHDLTQRVVRRLYRREVHDTFPTWYRLNTVAEVSRQARKGGLQMVRVERFANPDYFSFSPRLRRLAIVADWLLERVGTDLGRLYMVVTLRRPPAGAPAGGARAA